MNFLGSYYYGTFNNEAGSYKFLEPEPQRVLEWWLKGSDGNAVAAGNAGWMLLGGQGVEKDVPRALALLRRSIAGGYTKAKALLGEAYYFFYPPDVGKNNELEGLTLLKEAYCLGDRPARDYAKEVLQREISKPSWRRRLDALPPC